MKTSTKIFAALPIIGLAAGMAFFFLSAPDELKPESGATQSVREIALLPGVEAFVAELSAADSSGAFRIYKIRAALSAFPRTLSPDDVFALARAVDSQSVPAGREALEWGEVYNNAWNLIRAQKTPPRGLEKLLVARVEKGAPILRDYALQHLSELLAVGGVGDKALSEREFSAALAVVEKYAAAPGDRLCGTALNGLARICESDSGGCFAAGAKCGERLTRYCSAAFEGGSGARVETLVASAGILSAQRNPAALDSVRERLFNETVSLPVFARISLIHYLKTCGSDADRARLRKRFADSPDLRLRAAVGSDFADAGGSGSHPDAFSSR